MEKNEFDHDLIAPKGVYFQVLTERLNIMWREHLKRVKEKNGKRDEKTNSGSDQ
ncbi:hypothetical protein [Wolbachia endosymbiont of Encarsia formosa]|uniref:hypothetical protein n=1 Tax=Wolbachia endosymbiont of Encarsia formosa TaxID=77125 RepID=UPI0031B9CDB8